MTVTCTGCGKPVEEDARFCEFCGRSRNVSVAGGPSSKAIAAKTALLERLKTVTLGRYDVRGELGRGGMAAVYLAQDLRLNRRVALKVMLPGLAFTEGMADRFEQEARTAANLDHPNIVTIYSVEEAEDLFFFAMKYIEGRSLERVLKDVGTLPIDVVLYLLTSVGGALQYAHDERVIHRDVKPGNVLLDRRGTAIVSDFGIAKAAESSALTMTGAIVGTPAYMSPEQFRGQPAVPASDQYALGIMAYEMLAGDPPFKGSMVELQLAHLTQKPQPIGSVRPDVPPVLAHVVMRMLEKTPDARWPSLNAMAEALHGVSEYDEAEARSRIVELGLLASGTPAMGLPATPLSPIIAGTRAAPRPETPRVATPREQPRAAPVQAPPIAEETVVPQREDASPRERADVPAPGFAAAGATVVEPAAPPRVVSVPLPVPEPVRAPEARIEIPVTDAMREAMASPPIGRAAAASGAIREVTREATPESTRDAVPSAAARAMSEGARAVAAGVRSVSGKVRALPQRLPTGRPLWIGVGAIVLLAVAVPTILYVSRSGAHQPPNATDSTASGTAANPPAPTPAVTTPATPSPTPDARDSAVASTPSAARVAKPIAEITGRPAALHLSERVRLHMVVRDSSAAPARTVPSAWSSSNPAVIAVDQRTGFVTAIGIGEAEITAQSGTSRATTHLSVILPQVTGVEIVNWKPQLNAGEQAVLSARVESDIGPLDATTLGQLGLSPHWTSSNPEIARVDPATGAVQGVSGGSTVIGVAAGVFKTSRPLTVIGAVPTPKYVAPTPPVTSNNPPRTPSKADLERDAVQVIKSFASAFEAKDMAGMVRAYPSLSVDERRSFQSVFDDAQDIRYFIESATLDGPISDADGSEAKFQVRQSLTFFSKSNRKQIGRTGAHQVITVVRTGGSWKIRHIE